MRLGLLVVDDAPAVRLAVRRTLERQRGLSVDVTEAEDVAQARTAIAERVPQIVFLDLALGEGDPHDPASAADAVGLGHELLTERPEVAVVLFTSLGREDPRVDGLIARGAREHLRKPVRPEQVVQVVQGIMRQAAGMQRIT